MALRWKRCRRRLENKENSPYTIGGGHFPPPQECLLQVYVPALPRVLRGWSPFLVCEHQPAHPSEGNALVG
ncbi:hypothetical protein ZHAS_00007596 [Anopheles sinensis]|uniref:Uncharacterized protein n=1 Tax=Anopheles sinensis TaxID=74873 RepID=A0A084VQH6_ANOSI|nr:hypothetical protein ZHAS_00007596 [Anopheles sinensis]